jgi:hypothetical protein
LIVFNTRRIAMGTAMKLLSWRAVWTTLACAAAAPALAQLAKDGKVDLTLCWGGPTHAIAPTPNERFGNYSVTGGTRSAAGEAFDSMSVECLGSFESRGGVFQHKGYCVYQDRAGDRIYGVDTSGGGGYSWFMLGGTGKFAGISGSGQVERLGEMTPVRQGTLQGCRRMVGAYEFP